MSVVSTSSGVNYVNLSVLIVQGERLVSILLDDIDLGDLLKLHLSIYHDKFRENLGDSGC